MPRFTIHGIHITLFLILLSAGLGRAQDKAKIAGQPTTTEMQLIADSLKKKQECLKQPGPIDPSHCSNGCGPEWLIQKGKYQAFAELLNKRVFTGRLDGTDTVKSYPVDFAPACDLHDTGYAGRHVIDQFGDGENGAVDYRTWSRGRIDNKFYRDLCKICKTSITDSKEALDRCMGRLSRGAGLYKFAVEKIGYWSYDCNLNMDGPQFMSCSPGRGTYLVWNTDKMFQLVLGQASFETEPDISSELAAAGD